MNFETIWNWIILRYKIIIQIGFLGKTIIEFERWGNFFQNYLLTIKTLIDNPDIFIERDAQAFETVSGLSLSTENVIFFAFIAIMMMCILSIWKEISNFEEGESKFNKYTHLFTTLAQICNSLILSNFPPSILTSILLWIIPVLYLGFGLLISIKFKSFWE